MASSSSSDLDYWMGFPHDDLTEEQIKILGSYNVFFVFLVFYQHSLGSSKTPAQ